MFDLKDNKGFCPCSFCSLRSRGRSEEVLSTRVRLILSTVFLSGRERTKPEADIQLRCMQPGAVLPHTAGVLNCTS